MTKFTDKHVEAVFRMFPDSPRRRLLEFRQLIFETASDLDLADKIEETLKWGEPSYLTPKGSTVRIGWDEKDPEFVRLFFHCQTSLIETFRKLFPNLEYEGNRAIRFSISAEVEPDAIRKCIKLAMTYHSVKHLPLLGAGDE